MQRPKPYILWDWNGTLLDDTEAALATLNEMIAVRGGQPIGMEFYRDHFAFPVRPFYDKIGIIAHDEDEWNGIAHEYHEVYGRQPKKLNPLAVAALEMAKEAGCRQSIVSALRQDLLEADMARNDVNSLGCDEQLFRRIVKTVFNQRRKMLRVSLRQLLSADAIATLNADLTLRPEQLTIQQFVDLTNLISPLLPAS